MVAGAQLSLIERRGAMRHTVDLQLIAAHHDRGDLPVHIACLSATGFMADNPPDFARGERMVVRLPLVGRIEAHCMWTSGARAGFQFERIIREDDFADLLRQLQAARSPRRKS